MKKIIIVGAGSYIGNYFCNYIKDKNFEVSEIDTKTTNVEQMDFSKADVVLYIAGIAHIPLKKKTYR